METAFDFIGDDAGAALRSNQESAVLRYLRSEFEAAHRENLKRSMKYLMTR
jgi:hypothetical protein